MELGKALQELETSFSLMIVLPATRLTEVTTDTVRFFNSKGIPGVFVSFSKPHAALEEQFRKSKVDVSRLFFIDTMSESGGREENVLHVQSPSALTDINIALSQFAHSIPGERFVLLDAVNALRIYNDDGDVARFIGTITAKGATLRLKTIVLALKDPAVESLQRAIYPFFEKVIELG